MLRSSSCSSAACSSSSMSPFTVSQWKELEHQALIYKYLMAGLAVPPDLVLPIQKSFEAVSSRFFSHPTMGYCFYGKKIDPEPGRCRRTDGKKWRCSKDSYPDSKYCERHMHRGRNRSRKHVESRQTVSQPTSSSTATSIGGGAANTTVMHHLPPQSFGRMQSDRLNYAPNQSDFNDDQIPYGIPIKDYRYVHRRKPATGEHNFFSEAASGSNRNNNNVQMENTWSIPPSPKSTTNTDFAQIPLFSPDSAKQSNNSSLRPFFDEWPKARGSWPGIDEDKSCQGSYSTTQLSMSIPMVSSIFPGGSSQSPK